MYANKYKHTCVQQYMTGKCVFEFHFTETIFKSMQKLNTHSIFFFVLWHMAEADDIDVITTSALIHMLFSHKYHRARGQQF